MVRMLLVVIIALLAPTAYARSIGIFANDDCSSCALDIGGNETRTIYVSVVGAPHPILNASLAIAGLPPGWSTIAVPSPAANLSLGDPFAPDGSIIAFPELQSGPCILLYTVSLHAAGELESFALRVVAATRPDSPMLGCPTIFECDGVPCPFVPPICVAGGALLVNSPSGCNVIVTTSSWTAIRGIYR
jgi:hypothetical protein